MWNIPIRKKQIRSWHFSHDESVNWSAHSFTTLSHANTKEIKSLTDSNYWISLPFYFTSEILGHALILVELGNSYFIVFEMFKGIQRNVEELNLEFGKSLYIHLV